MDNKETGKRELDPEELDQVSGGTGAPTEEDLKRMIRESKELQKTDLETDEIIKKRLQQIKDMEAEQRSSIFN